MNVLTLPPNGLLSFNERKKGNERRKSSEFEHFCWVTGDNLTSLEFLELSFYTLLLEHKI